MFATCVSAGGRAPPAQPQWRAAAHSHPILAHQYAKLTLKLLGTSRTAMIVQVRFMISSPVGPKETGGIIAVERFTGSFVVYTLTRICAVEYTERVESA